MGVHVDYDRDKRIIYVTTAPTLTDGDWVVDLDIKTDVYSDGKEDWLGNDDLNKFYFPVRSVGGDDLPGEKSLGATFFLDSGWKLKPYEADHIFKVNGNFYSEDGTSPFVSTSGIYNIMVINTVSSLVDSIVQQLAEIEYASFGGGISIDVANGTPGTIYPCGTLRQPVDSLADAIVIATERGFSKFYILGNITLGATDDVDGYYVVGENSLETTITVIDGCSSVGANFQNCKIQGVLDESGCSITKSSRIGNLSGFSGFIGDCVLEGTIVLAGSSDVALFDCIDGFAGFGEPIIDFGGSGRGANIRGYQGGLRLENKSGSEDVSIGLDAGRLEIASDVIAGEIVVRGVGQISENSGSAVVSDSGLVNAQASADATWQHGSGVQLLTDTDLIKQIETGRWRIESNQMIFYEEDNTTEIMRFDLFDEAGDPANTDIFDRQRV